MAEVLNYSPIKSGGFLGGFIEADPACKPAMLEKEGTEGRAVLQIVAIILWTFWLSRFENHVLLGAQSFCVNSSNQEKLLFMSPRGK